MLFLFVLAVFLASFLLAAAAVMAAAHFLEKGAAGSSPKRGRPGESTAILKMEELSSISLWDSLLHKFDFVEGMRARIAESDMNWSVGRLTSLMLLVGAFAFAFSVGPFGLGFSADAFAVADACSFVFSFVGCGFTSFAAAVVLDLSVTGAGLDFPGAGAAVGCSLTAGGGFGASASACGLEACLRSPDGRLGMP